MRSENNEAGREVKGAAVSLSPPPDAAGDGGRKERKRKERTRHVTINSATGMTAPHATPEQIRGMERFYTPLVSDVMDSLGLQSGVLHRSVRPIFPDPALKVCGAAFPCRVVPTEEYVEIGTILEMVDAIPAGAFVLVAADADIDAALWGGLMSARAKARGGVAAAVNGGVRDIAQIAETGFPVFGTYRCIKDIRRRGFMHSYGVPVRIGGVEVSPGDIILGDANGVVAIPGEHFGRVYAELEKALDEESATQRGLTSGGSARELFGEHGRF